MKLPPHYRRPTPSGSILLLVLVAVLMMSLATSSYMLMMHNEHKASRQSGKLLQADYLTRSGIAYLQEFLSQSALQIEQQGGLVSNASSFQGVLVIDDPWDTERGRFTVVSPDMEQGLYTGVVYGLENESAKINLNELVESDDESTNSARQRLLALPGMEPSIADAILDWMDADSIARDQGAEDQYYQGLAPAYSPRNGRIHTLDELLMVRGVTPELLYGMDVNRNLLIDDNEQPQGAFLQLDNTLGQMDRGWAAYLTVHSFEKSVSPEGDKLIDINSDDLKQLHADISAKLGDEAANFILAARQYEVTQGTTNGFGENPTGPKSQIQIDFDKEARNKIDSLLDLVGASVSITSDDGNSQALQSPWQDNPASYRQEFSELLDYVTVDGDNGNSGRINIQRASRPVLLSIPDVTEVFADQVLSRRNSQVDSIRGEQRHAIWLLIDGIMTLDEFKEIWPYITTRGDVYSGQVIGFFDDGPAQVRARVILDRAGDKVQLVGFEDFRGLGPGFSPTELGAQPITQNTLLPTTP